MQKVYTPKQVAENLGCSLENVYRMIKYGQLKAFRISGRRNYRVTEDSLNDFIERMIVRKEEMNGVERD